MSTEVFNFSFSSKLLVANNAFKFVSSLWSNSYFTFTRLPSPGVTILLPVALIFIPEYLELFLNSEGASILSTSSEDILYHVTFDGMVPVAT